MMSMTDGEAMYCGMASQEGERKRVEKELNDKIEKLYESIQNIYAAIVLLTEKVKEIEGKVDDTAG